VQREQRPDHRRDRDRGQDDAGERRARVTATPESSSNLVLIAASPRLTRWRTTLSEQRSSPAISS
jgi:hypothetical protein